MSTRIRYAVSSDNKFLKRSIKPIDADGRQVTVALDEKKFHFVIYDYKSNEVIAFGGNTTNPNILKLQAKKALEDLGVVFSTENRNRGGKIKLKKSKLSRHEAPPNLPNKVMQVVEKRLSTFEKSLKTEVSELLEAHKLTQVSKAI